MEEIQTMTQAVKQTEIEVSGTARLWQRQLSSQKAIQE